MTEHSETSFNDTISAPFTRIELINKYDDLMPSDALMQLPGDMAYQQEWVKILKSQNADAIAMKRKCELKEFVSLEGKVKTTKERELQAELVASEEYDHVISKTRLDYELAQVAYDYLEDLFIALRKLYTADEPSPFHPRQERGIPSNLGSEGEGNL